VGRSRPLEERAVRRRRRLAVDGEHGVRAREAAGPLAERAGGQRPLRRLVAGEQHEVGVARERAVLEAVVEDDRVEPEALAR
jgi:hypothetical protein